MSAVPRRLLREPLAPVENPVRWGILGTGRVTRHLVASARAGAGVLAGVGSRDATRCSAFATEHGIERAYGSYEQLLADDSVEAVYIALPNSMHVEWTMRALEAGKHVLCEKPLSDDVAAVDAAFELARRQERVLMEGLMHLHHPQWQRVRELIRDGAIGEPQVMRCVMSFPLQDAANIRLSRKLDGGALLDLGCYPVSAARWLMGEPHAVVGGAVFDARDVDSRFFGTLWFGSECVLRFEVAFTLPRRQEFEILGSDGAILLSSPFHCREPRITCRSVDDERVIETADSDPYTLEFAAMAAAIRRGEPQTDWDYALGQARTLSALMAAAREHRGETGAG